MAQNKRRLNVLSIDGGGIRGIVPALILAEIERTTGKPIAKLFDVIAGTSTGGILGMALTKPRLGSAHYPDFSAEDLVDLYAKEGHRFFPKSKLRSLVSTVYGSKFPEKGLESLLVDRFGDSHLSDALTDLTVATYDIEYRRGFFFKSRKAKDPGLEAEYDFLMRDVARATSAAPTYFKPASVKAKGSDTHWHLVDGGVCANNPALVGYTEAMRIHEHDNICLVSIGTGELTDSLPIKQTKRWGMMQWAMPAIDVMFDGATHTTHYQLDTLLPEWSYYRFQPWLKDASDSMEDCSVENIERLKRLVHRWAEEEAKSAQSQIRNPLDRGAKRLNRLQKCCEHLMDNKFHYSLDDFVTEFGRAENEVRDVLQHLPDSDLLHGMSEHRGAVSYSDEAHTLLARAFR